MRKEGEGREEEKREEGRAKEGDERTVDAPGDANDRVVTSRSADRSHPASNERRAGSFATTTSHNTPPTQPYDLSAPPVPFQPPATPLYWCDPVTVTLAQIEENTRRLLCEWPKDDSVPFPTEVLDMLNDLRMKVRSRDEERARKIKPLMMADPPTEIPAQRANTTLGTARTTTPESLVNTKANEEETTRETNAKEYPAEDNPTNRTPALFDWAEDVDAHLANTAASNQPSRLPRDFSALRSGTRNPWATLSRRHNHHHRLQPPCDLSALTSAT